MKTVAALANGDGGSVVFGMDSDEATPVGLEGLSEKQERDRLGDLIRRYLHGRPSSGAAESRCRTGAC